MTVDQISEDTDSDQLARAVAKLEARATRMHEANDVLAKWGSVSAPPALLALGLNREVIARIAPRSGPVGFRPQEIAAVEGAVTRLRSQLRKRRIALRQFVTGGQQTFVETVNVEEQTRH